ncbi:hypothetical protein V2K65_03525 [Pseudomonas alliivorans]|nr:hypothetical protein [Pseudomonas alliivorans]MEE4745997.1 hypothetical protein [Pseudomonas alliivorans]MEE4912571.1 hypothetical protein [Pseudomonas alliivorans]
MKQRKAGYVAGVMQFDGEGLASGGANVGQRVLLDAKEMQEVAHRVFDDLQRLSAVTPSCFL